MEPLLHHTAHPPVMVVDSSSLLTLLLAGEEHQQHYGYMRLLMGLAKRGLIELKTTDMVVSELLGLQAPITAPLFFGNPPQVKAENVRYGYRFAAQRVGMLRDLLADGHIEIIQTACGEEYLARLRDLLAEPENTHLATRYESWPPSHDSLVARLCKPNTKLARAVHAHNLSETIETTAGEVRVAVKNGCKDRGEISIADAIRSMQHRDASRPIFVLYEGGDVRGRIIQRLQFREPAPHAPLYNQYGGELEERFNPNMDGFDPQSVRHLGAINFVTSYAFLQSLMLAADAVEGTGDKRLHARERQLYIVRPHEADSISQSYDSYKVLMQRVGEKGLPRAYNRFRDCSVQAVGDETSQKPPRHLAQATGPWARYVQTLVQEPQTHAMLRDMFTAFASYRMQQTEHTLDACMHHLLEEVALLPPQRAVVVLQRMQHDMQRLHKYMAIQCDMQRSR